MWMTRTHNPLTATFGRQLDRLFQEAFDEVGVPTFGPGGFPALNVWDDGDNLNAEAEVPGMKLEDIEIYVVGNELSLKGQRVIDRGENDTFHRRERFTGRFERSVTLPVKVDAENVKATLRDGVLSIALPKAPEARARKIEVRSA